MSEHISMKGKDMNEHDMIEKEILETVGATSGCIEADASDDDACWIGNDVSEYDDEPNPSDEQENPEDDGMTDVEADAATLAGAGWGTDEDYGYFGGGDE